MGKLEAKDLEGKTESMTESVMYGYVCLPVRAEISMFRGTKGFEDGVLVKIGNTTYASSSESRGNGEDPPNMRDLRKIADLYVSQTLGNLGLSLRKKE